ncbi:MAG: DHHA1 domain-containing protein [Candidatus Heimdallarchaeota archaeon]
MPIETIEPAKDPSGFVQQALKIRQVIKKSKDELLLISHHDSDGIAALAVMSDFLDRLDRDYEYRIIKGIDSVIIEDINECAHSLVIFLDLGNDPTLTRLAHWVSKAIIIDHHIPDPMIVENPIFLQLNPHLFGFDGSYEASSSTTTYFVTQDQPIKALVGCIGDLQYRRTGRLESLNREVLDSSPVIERKDVMFFGRNRPLFVSLAYSSDPYIPGLTGDLEACKAFLINLDLGPKHESTTWVTLDELNNDEKKRLVGGLAQHAMMQGVTSIEFSRLIGWIYLSSDATQFYGLRDLREIATALNACGRLQRYELAFSFLKQTAKCGKVLSILNTYRARLAESLKILADLEPKPLGAFYLIDARDLIDERIAGVVLGMGLGSRIVPTDRPALILASSTEGALKLSARTTQKLINRNKIHLARILRKITKGLEAEAGGHDIAAGAHIPAKALPAFLERLGKTSFR